VANEDDGEPVAFGKDDARNLHTGDVVGDDPLEPFLFSKFSKAVLNFLIDPVWSERVSQAALGNHPLERANHRSLISIT